MTTIPELIDQLDAVTAGDDPPEQVTVDRALLRECRQTLAGLAGALVEIGSRREVNRG